MQLDYVTEAGMTQAVVESVEDISADIRVFRMRPSQHYDFFAGQYAYVSFNGQPPRPYSIAIRPGLGMLEFHIKRGVSKASRYIMDEVRAGDMVSLSDPQGSSIYDAVTHMPILAIAGGLGVAPIKAIIEEALFNNHAQAISLYWGTALEQDQYLKDFFEKLAVTHQNFTFHGVVGGKVTEVSMEGYDDLSGTHIYVSGAPAMISHAIPFLLEKKAERSKIFYDRHPEADNLVIS